MSRIDCCTPKVREIYEMAVEAEPPYSLSDADCKTMCVRYAQLETRVRSAAWITMSWCYSRRRCSVPAVRGVLACITVASGACNGLGLRPGPWSAAQHGAHCQGQAASLQSIIGVV